MSAPWVEGWDVILNKTFILATLLQLSFLKDSIKEDGYLYTITIEKKY